MLDDRITDSRATTPHGRDLPGPIEVEEIAEESLQRRHEVQDVRLRPLLIFAGVMLIAAVVIHVVVWWMLRIWTDDDLGVQIQLPPAAVTPQPAPGPGVEPFPRAELEDLQMEQADRMNSYGWVDRETGVVHIPVERAMELLLERGVPARDDAPAPTFRLNRAYELESQGGQARLPVDAVVTEATTETSDRAATDEAETSSEAGAAEGDAADEND